MREKPRRVFEPSPSGAGRGGGGGGSWRRAGGWLGLWAPLLAILFQLGLGEEGGGVPATDGARPVGLGAKRHVSKRGEFHFRARTRSFMGAAAFERWPALPLFLKSRDKSNQSEGLTLISWIATYTHFGFHKCQI